VHGIGHPAGELAVGGVEVREAGQGGGDVREQTGEEVVLEPEREEAGEVGERGGRDGPAQAVVGEDEAYESWEPREGVRDGAGEVVVGEVEELEAGDAEEERVEGAVEAIPAEVERAELAEVGARLGGSSVSTRQLGG
jgi:hypothetical protein